MQSSTELPFSTSSSIRCRVVMCHRSNQLTPHLPSAIYFIWEVAIRFTLMSRALSESELYIDKPVSGASNKCPVWRRNTMTAKHFYDSIPRPDFIIFETQTPKPTNHFHKEPDFARGWALVCCGHYTPTKRQRTGRGGSRLNS